MKFLIASDIHGSAAWCRRLMDALDAECPQYGWRRNKGYPTREHREAIRQHGITPYHRRSYNLTGQELPLPFDD